MSKSYPGSVKVTRWSVSDVPVIQTQALTKTYSLGSTQVRALRGVSFSVQASEFVALMGTSGSGKSTLMHLLGCLDTPTAGTYLLNGQDVAHLSENRRAVIRNQQIGFVFQTFNLLPRLSALENVALPLRYQKGASNIKASATAALAQVGLKDRGLHRPAELSGGQRQRVAIARALITNPTLILADEPTGNLDSATSTDIMNLLADLTAQGRTILMVTHDSQTAAYAQRTLHMQDGVLC